MSSSIDVSIVVPVFRGEQTLFELYKRVVDTLSNKEKTFEVLFIHDGGTAASWEAIVKLQKANKDQIRVFRFAKNYGQNAATQCGLQKAKGQLVITIDEDLQTPPEDIKLLIDEYESGNYDLIFGIPEKTNQSVFRRIGSRLTKTFFRQIEGLDIGSSFRLLSFDLIQRMEPPHTEHLFINQVVNWYTDRVGFVTVRNEPKQTTKSGYTIFGLIQIALRLVLFYSDFLLRLMIYFGVIISLICLGLGSFFIYEKLTLGAELGFTSIIVAIFFSTGILITCFSIVGLYIQRIFKNQLNRPVYSVDLTLE